MGAARSNTFETRIASTEIIAREADIHRRHHRVAESVYPAAPAEDDTDSVDPGPEQARIAALDLGIVIVRSFGQNRTEGVRAQVCFLALRGAGVVAERL